MGLAVFRPTTALWYIIQSASGTTRIVSWGLASDKFDLGDFDSDGKTDVGVYRNGTWYILISGTNALSAVQFGTAADTAIAGLNSR